jgi:hypothetical protein
MSIFEKKKLFENASKNLNIDNFCIVYLNFQFKGKLVASTLIVTSKKWKKGNS